MINVPLIENKQASAGNNTISSIDPTWSILQPAGYKLYTDEVFSDGNNSISVYNNAGGSAVTHTRKNSAFADGHSQPPNTSGYVIEIRHAPTESSGTTPGYGGWYFATPTGSGRRMVCIFKMKVPLGRFLTFHSNSMGTSSDDGWLTSNEGTGLYEDYAYYVNCGTTAYSSTFFFAVHGGSSTTFYSYLASATVYDLSESCFSFERIDKWRGGLTRRWDSYPTITIYNDTRLGPQSEFRIEGFSGVSGADFSVVTRCDGGYLTGSDSRRKINVEPINQALSTVLALTGKSFHIINSEGSIQDNVSLNGKKLGFLAQEAAAIIPECTKFYPEADTPNEQGWASAYSIDYAGLIPLLTEAIKEQQQQIDALKAEVERLKGLVSG